MKLTYEEVEYTARVAESAILQEIQRLVKGEQLWRVAVSCDDATVCEAGELSIACHCTPERAKQQLRDNIAIGRKFHAKMMRAYNKALKLIDEQGAE